MQGCGAVLQVLTSRLLGCLASLQGSVNLDSLLPGNRGPSHQPRGSTRVYTFTGVPTGVGKDRLVITSKRYLSNSTRRNSCIISIIIQLLYCIISNNKQSWLVMCYGHITNKTGIKCFTYLQPHTCFRPPCVCVCVCMCVCVDSLFRFACTPPPTLYSRQLCSAPSPPTLTRCVPTPGSQGKHGAGSLQACGHTFLYSEQRVTLLCVCFCVRAPQLTGRRTDWHALLAARTPARATLTSRVFSPEGTRQHCSTRLGAF